MSMCKLISRCWRCPVVMMNQLTYRIMMFDLKRNRWKKLYILVREKHFFLISYLTETCPFEIDRLIDLLIVGYIELFPIRFRSALMLVSVSMLVESISISLVRFWLDLACCFLSIPFLKTNFESFLPV